MSFFFFVFLPAAAVFCQGKGGKGGKGGTALAIRSGPSKGKGDLVDLQAKGWGASSLKGLVFGGATPQQKKIHKRKG